MTRELPTDALRAIESAKRSQGWNNRRGDVQRFKLINLHGRAPCELYVVPARVWAYRRWEQQAISQQHGMITA